MSIVSSKLTAPATTDAKSPRTANRRATSTDQLRTLGSSRTVRAATDALKRLLTVKRATASSLGETSTDPRVTLSSSPTIPTITDARMRPRTVSQATGRSRAVTSTSLRVAMGLSSSTAVRPMAGARTLTAEAASIVVMMEERALTVRDSCTVATAATIRAGMEKVEGMGSLGMGSVTDGRRCCKSILEGRLYDYEGLRSTTL